MRDTLKKKMLYQIMLFLLLMLLTPALYSQQFVPVGNGIQTLAGIHAGTVVYKGKIYAADRDQIYRWDGTIWKSMNITVDFALTCMVVYNDELYVGGWFTEFNGQPVNRIMKYNGIVWKPLNGGITIAENHTGGIERMIVYKNELILYAPGALLAGSTPVKGIVSWNGSNWGALGEISHAYLTSMIVYNDELYVFGNLAVPGNTMKNIVKWNDSDWIQVGDGLDYIPTSSVIYKDQLYVIQHVDDSSGTSQLIKWDGTEWTEVETNLDTPYRMYAFSMKEFNGCLYMAGSFSGIDEIYMHDDIVRFDGNNWFTILDSIDGYPVNLVEFNDELYVTGHFTTYGSTVVNNVLKLQHEINCTTTGVDDELSDSHINFYPVPVSNVLNIETNLKDHHKIDFKIVDVLGRLKKSGSTNTNQIPFDDLTEGLYLLDLSIGENRVTKRIIKQ
jgi:hypothetical protein